MSTLLTSMALFVVAGVFVTFVVFLSSILLRAGVEWLTKERKQ